MKERLGNKKNGLFLYLFLIILNLFVHLFILFNENELKGITILHFFLSLLAFTYLACFIADFIWSIKPSVVKLFNGKKKINALYYMNTYQLLHKGEKLPSVTISIPLYKENNDVIFNTIKDSIKAKESYIKKYKTYCNIVVSDDGIASLLNQRVDQEKIEELIDIYNHDGNLTAQEIQVIERIIFYRKNNIGFVIRPKDNRNGLFKKASNLNFTLNISKLVKNNEAINFEYYMEGDIETQDIILLLDKDSGVPQNIIETVIPEFVNDKKLAYVQCATSIKNINDNFYTKIVGRQTNDLFQNIWPSQALRGFFVPLVGHNVFIRQAALEDINNWDENKVSEDFDAAIRLNALGYHGKYYQVEGMEFTEYCSRLFTEESSKQYRYIYGIFEMMFDGTIKLGKTRWYDVFYMILYFLSKLCIISTIPYTIFILLFYSSYNVGIICCGFAFCQIIFILLPFIRKIILYKYIKHDYLFSFKESILLAISFIGHSVASMNGFILYLTNKFRKRKKTFSATSVEKINYSINDSFNAIYQFILQNKSFLIVVLLSIICIVNLFLRSNLFIFFKFVYIYILVFIIISPIIFNIHLQKIMENFKWNFKLIRYVPATIIIIITILLSQNTIGISESSHIISQKSVYYTINDKCFVFNKEYDNDLYKKYLINIKNNSGKCDLPEIQLN